MTNGAAGETIIGREAARRVLAQAYQSPTPRLVSVIGRRRIGKTFLVRRHFANEMVFQVTGLAGVGKDLQLQNFRLQLETTFGEGTSETASGNWLAAFAALARALDAALSRAPERRVVFLDELPWLASARSGFLAAFGWFWNSWAFDRRVVVVICGSAASWMLRRVVRDKGSLHNRITDRIRLQPFDLSEFTAYLNDRGIVAEPYQRLQLYMALGGVPFYLEKLAPGRSAAGELERLLFDVDAPLAGEFDLLYASLFERPERHVAVVRYLGARPGGVPRTDLDAAKSLPSGGGLTKVVAELEASGFVQVSRPFGSKRKGAIIRLIDEYSAFYLKFLADAKPGAKSFLKVFHNPSYRSWSGFAFERVCLRHPDVIQRALGIEGSPRRCTVTWLRLRSTLRGYKSTSSSTGQTAC